MIIIYHRYTFIASYARINTSISTNPCTEMLLHELRCFRENNNENVQKSKCNKHITRSNTIHQRCCVFNRLKINTRITQSCKNVVANQLWLRQWIFTFCVKGRARSYEMWRHLFVHMLCTRPIYLRRSSKSNSFILCWCYLWYNINWSKDFSIIAKKLQ